jgi:hypothetical protein
MSDTLIPFNPAVSADKNTQCGNAVTTITANCKVAIVRYWILDTE